MCSTQNDLPLADGVVAMIGDSITATAGWWMAFRNQLMARNPGTFFDFRNLGVPGGGVRGALHRYDWDIAPNAPTTAFVLFGMNDVWRDGYVPVAGPETFEGRDYAIQEFLAGMLALCERLQADGVRVILLTPTPYDEFQTGEESLNFRGVNQALGVLSGMVRGIAAARGIRCIDFHTPLSRLYQEGAPIISPDRVHPNAAGEAAMTQVLLDHYSMSPPVPISPAIEEASQRLFVEEHQLRILAAVKCRAYQDRGPLSPEVLREWIHIQLPHFPVGWLREKMIQSLEWIGQETDFVTRVEMLRRELASSNPAR